MGPIVKAVLRDAVRVADNPAAFVEVGHRYVPGMNFAAAHQASASDANLSLALASRWFSARDLAADQARRGA